MAKTVIDLLEAIEVKVEDPAILVGIAQAAAQREVDVVKKKSTVGQTRQHVVHGIVL